MLRGPGDVMPGVSRGGATMMKQSIEDVSVAGHRRALAKAQQPGQESGPADTVQP
jgi:hypothetical protein